MNLTAAQLDELEAYVDEVILPMHGERRASTLRALLELGREQQDALEALNQARLMAYDPEAAHSAADHAVLAASTEEVRDAYTDVQESCAWWASA